MILSENETGGQDGPSPRPLRTSLRARTNPARLTGALLLAILCAVTASAADQLDGWPFSDTNWLSWIGYAPVAFTNLVNARGGDGHCLELNSTNPAFLRYNVIEDDAT